MPVDHPRVLFGQPNWLLFLHLHYSDFHEIFFFKFIKVILTHAGSWDQTPCISIFVYFYISIFVWTLLVSILSISMPISIFLLNTFSQDYFSNLLEPYRKLLKAVIFFAANPNQNAYKQHEQIKKIYSQTQILCLKIQYTSKKNLTDVGKFRGKNWTC